MGCNLCSKEESPTWYTVVKSEENIGIEVDIFCSSGCVAEALK